MDAVKCLKDLGRMCGNGCQFPVVCDECDYWIEQHPEEAVRIIEEWSKAHPIVTNGDAIINYLKQKRRESLLNHPRQNDWFDSWTENIMEFFGQEWWNAPYEAPTGEM